MDDHQQKTQQLLTLYLPIELHREFKAACAQDDTSMKQVVQDAVEEYVTTPEASRANNLRVLNVKLDEALKLLKQQ